MIRLVEALNYRCLRYIRCPLERFLILVGPNASGKTTFLDVVAFLSDMVGHGVREAIEKRCADFRDLLWNRQGEYFELAIEAQIPEDRRASQEHFDTIRYCVRVGTDPQTKELGILEERGWLLHSDPLELERRTLFPDPKPPPSESLFPSRGKRRTLPPGKGRTVFSKSPGGNDHFYSEVRTEAGKGWFPSLRLGPRRSALGTLPENEQELPASTWLRSLLLEGVQTLMLNSLLLRRPSRPGLPQSFLPDGSNLPWLVHRLKHQHPERFQDWIAHLQTALPDLQDISTYVREEDRHCYVKLHYSSGLVVPSWVASDGTLRMMALTLLAYLPEVQGVYLVEEPENGIHPQAVETVFHSLASVYRAQVLLATHSPVLLSLAQPEQILCFQKDSSGATDVVRGTQHPELMEWKGTPNLSVLFASGVLG